MAYHHRQSVLAGIFDGSGDEAKGAHRSRVGGDGGIVTINKTAVRVISNKDASGAR